MTLEGPCQFKSLASKLREKLFDYLCIKFLSSISVDHANVNANSSAL